MIGLNVDELLFHGFGRLFRRPFVAASDGMAAGAKPGCRLWGSGTQHGRAGREHAQKAYQSPDSLGANSASNLLKRGSLRRGSQTGSSLSAP